ncbi:ParB/RepB/Spo0J family partition protein [Actinomadura rupiterrae]|uniref:ParB/RepB/Spo0J family partition protein n=1 Tax=Actinomadura rupiterrae TaxID=559627 RepID=UPI0020A40DA7|nr:ParB/RepB/Spo0J family partition protein [Actinomadura rupiterrae]MCP2336073.1 ParB-like chromosome segregation protein Spo0J [Actinomadura rupiterrae]
MEAGATPLPRPAPGDAAADTATAPDPPTTPAAEVRRIAIGSLLPADSPRLHGEDREHILRLSEIETPLPPILVHRPAMRVIDGMHRLRAAILRGETSIEVVFFDGTEAEAFARAVELNVTHGLPLSHADRRAAAARIMAAEPRLSDRVVAARTGLSDHTVAAVRRSTAHLPRSNSRVGADGRIRPLDGGQGRRRAAEIITARPETPLREVAKAAGISLSTAHDVRRRLLNGESPAPPARAVPAPPERPKRPERSEQAQRAKRAERPVPVALPAAARRTAGQGQERPELLRRLMRDPSLRHTATGRELLRMLRADVPGPDERDALADLVPEHCREAVTDLARQFATAWERFADAVERPGPGGDRA